MAFIGEDLFHFQATISQSGSTFEDFIRDNYDRRELRQPRDWRRAQPLDT